MLPFESFAATGVPKEDPPPITPPVALTTFEFVTPVVMLAGEEMSNVPVVTNPSGITSTAPLFWYTKSPALKPAFETTGIVLDVVGDCVVRERDIINPRIHKR